jgi:hypothetical protein
VGLVDVSGRWKDIWAAGQGLQAIDSIEPVAVIVDRIEQEYRQAIRRAASRVEEPSLETSARRS